MRNTSVHAVPRPAEEDDSLLESPGAPDADVVPHWSDTASAVTLLEQMLIAVDSIQSDAKFEAVHKLVRQLLSDNPQATRRICILTAYRDTALFLRSALHSRDLRVYAVNGSMPGSEREDQVRTFLAQGDVLVATDAALQGFDLTPVDDVIYYDRTTSEMANHQRLSRFWRMSRRRPLQIYLLWDDSGVLPNETENAAVV